MTSHFDSIPPEDRDFFVLLRAGLWQKVEVPLSAKPDWRHIYELATGQTVQGVVTDGWMLYEAYAADHPDYARDMPPQVRAALLEQMASIVSRNFAVNAMQAQLEAMFTQQHIPHYVVKGQQAGRNYPKPNLRCSGDIDILIRPEDFSRSRELLMPMATEVETFDKNAIHQGFHIGDIEVELHGSLRPVLGKRINNGIDALQRELFEGGCSYDTFCAMYIFLHCLQHFFWSGLGLRQISDWATYLTARHAEIDWRQVHEAIKTMGLSREWCIFLQFAEGWLGMGAILSTESGFPAGKSQADGKVVGRLWQECKATGNMGSMRARSKTPDPHFLRRNWRLFMARLARVRQTFPVSPRCALNTLFKTLCVDFDIAQRKLTGLFSHRGE